MPVFQALLRTVEIAHVEEHALLQPHHQLIIQALHLDFLIILIIGVLEQEVQVKEVTGVLPVVLPLLEIVIQHLPQLILSLEIKQGDVLM